MTHKPVKRQCPQCLEVKEFRGDNKTCGCARPVIAKPAAAVAEPATARESFLRSEVSSLKSELAKAQRGSGYAEELLDQLTANVSSIEALPALPYVANGQAGADIYAVLKLSDWHIGAMTRVEETEGFGEFNWALAQERVNYIAQKFLGWIETHRRSFNIPKLYIFSEGDMVSGNIHYELEVTNEFPAPVQAVKAGNLLASVVATLAPHFPEVHLIEINIDNHSRLTRKLQFAQGGENSWGYVVHALANARLASHGNISITEAPGIRELVNVNGVKFLVEHGHVNKAWNGIPFYGIERFKGKESAKRMTAMMEVERGDFLQYQKDIGFDYLSQGHWHVPSIISNNILINGCLPGTTEYDHAAGRYARPAQVSFLVHPKYKLFDWTAWSVKR